MLFKWLAHHDHVSHAPSLGRWAGSEWRAGAASEEAGEPWSEPHDESFMLCTLTSELASEPSARPPPAAATFGA